jgi:hypothetical protein
MQKRISLDFPILKDEKNKVADKFELLLLRKFIYLTVIMKYFIMEELMTQVILPEFSSKDLSKALDEILTGKKVSNAKTKAFGCTIKRV